MKKILKNERGSEVIEFVILFPILVFLIFGAITFFLATYSKIIIADAAREGARAGALASTRNNISVLYFNYFYSFTRASEHLFKYKHLRFILAYKLGKISMVSNSAIL